MKITQCVGLLCLSWFVLLALAGQTRARADVFPQTGYRLDDGHGFLSYWQQHGGLAQFGYPITAEYSEHNTSDGEDYIVQWFERARFEYHPEAPPQYRVLLGLLGHALVDARIAAGETPFMRVAATLNVRGRRYFGETGHTLGSGFRDYWEAHGGLAIYGLPLSEEFVEVSPEDGKSYTVQYLERARFEYHPEAPQEYRVLLGLLGKQARLLMPVAAVNDQQMALAVPPQFAQGIFATPRTFMLPPGYHISVFANNVIGARLMAVAPNGDVFVGSNPPGNIYVLPDRARTGAASDIRLYATKLNGPHSLAFNDNYLYVAELGRVLRYAYVTGDLAPRGQPEVVVPNLPTGGQHVTRTILFAPDSDANGTPIRNTWKMYISVGSTCDICEETDPQRATVLQYNPDGSDGKIFARGLRNAVGLARNPLTDHIWASGNERNTLGEENPPDYLVRLKAGINLGWPYCYTDIRGVWQPDPDVGVERSAGCDADDLTHPNVLLGGHSAPLGLTFIDAAFGAWSEPMRGGIVVAQHGTGGDIRQQKIGYNVIFQGVDTDGRTIGGTQEFAGGWLNPDGTYWGRPVGVIFGADAALYISDDIANAVYRVTYTG